MENFQLDHDIHVYYVEADSFPMGIGAAQEKIHAFAPLTDERNFFGISFPGKDGKIVYKAAAAESFPGELQSFGLPEFVIRKGTYTSIILHDYPKRFMEFENIFRELLQHPALDPQGCCVEWYLDGKDCRCMVRLEI